MFNTTIPKELYPSDPRFGVGPSLIPVEYVERLAQTKSTLLGTSHRQKAVKDLVKQMQAGLDQYFNLPTGYEIVLGNGGATFLFDMIGLGLVEKKSAHFTCGEFSQKWFKAHHKIPWIEAQNIEVPYGKGIDVKDIEDADMICATLNETSTGVMLKDLPNVSKDTLLAIDATSGAGQIKVDFNKVDLYFFSPQKVFAAEGGFYVAIMSPKAIKRYEKMQSMNNRYIPEIMNWKYAIENSRKHQTFNTPCISNIFYLNEQVKRLNELGESQVISIAQEKAKFIYQWAQDKSYLAPFVENIDYRSQAVATIDVDEKYPVNELSKVLRDKHLAYDIVGYRKLGRNQLRLSLFHNTSLENLEKLTKMISFLIEN